METLLLSLKTDPLELRYDPSSLRLFLGGSELIPEVRRLRDLSDVLYDREFYSKADKERPLYHMFRSLARSQDRKLCEAHGLRFDITFVPPSMLGEEYVKTLGHCHPEAQSGLTYPELYEVLQGRADFLLQRWEDDKSCYGYIELKDVVLLRACEGDRILVPPNYGHITINPSGELLVLANWVSNAFFSLYEPFKRMGGGAYFELSGGRLVPNARYGNPPSPRVLWASEIEAPPLPRARSLYDAFLREPESLGFLNDPKLIRGFKTSLGRKVSELG